MNKRIALVAGGLAASFAVLVGVHDASAVQGTTASSSTTSGSSGSSGSSSSASGTDVSVGSTSGSAQATTAGS